MESDEEDVSISDVFQEPEGYRQVPKPATYTEYTTHSGQVIRLRLVGHNPLWGHYLWNGGQILSTYLQSHASRLVHGKAILELGAGAGLPSLVASLLGAQKVVVTDYPDVELIENLNYNIGTLPQAQAVGNILAQGYLWGAPVKPLLSHLPIPSRGFETLLLADLLFNHHCHVALVSTILESLARTPSARALVFFTPYRPWLLEKDLVFFGICRDKGLRVHQVTKQIMERVMFEEDEGNELLRRTVFGYEVKWNDLDESEN